MAETSYTPADALEANQVDIDPDTGQSVGNVVDPPDTPPPSVPDVVDETPSPEPPPDPRKEIYENARRNREQAVVADGENDAVTKLMTRRMELEAGGTSSDEQIRILTEEFGTLDSLPGELLPQGAIETPPARELLPQGAIETPPAPPVVPAAAPTDPSVSTVDTGADEWVTLTVDGQEQFATATEAVEAGGIEALQKQRSADQQMQANAVERQRLDTQLETLNEQWAEIRTAAESLDRQGQTPPSGESPGTQGNLDSRINELTDDLLSGDEERTRVAVRNLLTPSAPTGTTEVPAQPQAPGATAQPQQQLTAAQQEANGYFKAQFQDIAAKPELMGPLRQRVTYLQDMPGEETRPLTDIIADAGQYIRRLYIKPDSAQILPAEEVRQRIAQKRATVGPQAQRPAASSAAPQKPPMSEAEKRHQAVREQQKARGQPVTN